MMKIFRMVSSITITMAMCASCPADDDMQAPGTCDDIPGVPGSWSPLGCRLRWSPASIDADTKVASRVLQFCHRCTSIFTIFSTYYRLLLSLRCVFNHDFPTLNCNIYLQYLHQWVVWWDEQSTCPFDIKYQSQNCTTLVAILIQFLIWHSWIRIIFHFMFTECCGGCVV